MRAPLPNARRAAFSLVEVLIVIGTIAVVAAVLVPRLTRTKPSVTRFSCINNLKNVGLAFRTFAVDYNGSYPWMIDEIALLKDTHPLSNMVSSDLIRIFGCLSNELSTPRIVMCPEDVRRPPATNTWTCLAANGAVADLIPSYFIGLNSTEEQPQTILSGDRNVLVPPALDWTRVTGTMPAWRLHEAPTNALSAVQWGRETIHQGAGNLLLADGSVQQASSGRLRDAIRDAQAVTNAMTWLMPVDH
jgi:prepilin-type processing-associated H-X9-DG protein